MSPVPPVLMLMPPSPPTFGPAAVDDLFAALFQQLAGPVALPDGDAAPLRVAAAVGPAARAAVRDERDPATTTAGVSPPLWAQPALAVASLAPAVLPEVASSEAPPVAAAGIDTSLVPRLTTPSDLSGGAEPVATNLSAPLGGGGIAFGPSQAVLGSSSVPASGPETTSPVSPRQPEAAAWAPALALAAAGVASAPAQPWREAGTRIVEVQTDAMRSAPLDHVVEATPIARAAASVDLDRPARGLPFSAGRAVQEPGAAVAPDALPEATVDMTATELPQAARNEVLVEIAAPTRGGSSGAESLRGVGPTPGPVPSIGGLADERAVALAPQLTVALVRQAKDGLERVKVQLHPAELGGIEIALEVDHDGQARAAFLAERPETVDLLRREAGHLERALREVGVEVASGGMSFASRDPQGGRDRQPDTPAGPPQPIEPVVIEPGPPRATAHAALRLLDLTV